MAKNNKEFDWRMQGMLYAHKIVQEKGLEALTKEIKMRGMLKLDLWARKGEVEELEMMLSKNLYANMLATFMFTLHDMFGFGKSRLQRLKEGLDKAVENVMDLDWMGGRYVRLQDYALELNEKYDLGLDIERIIECQELQEEPEGKRRVELETMLQELRENGFDDAAEFLGNVA